MKKKLMKIILGIFLIFGLFVLVINLPYYNTFYGKDSLYGYYMVRSGEKIFPDYAASEIAKWVYDEQEKYFEKEKRFAGTYEELIPDKEVHIYLSFIMVDFESIDRINYRIKVYYKTKPEFFYIVTRDGVIRVKKGKRSEWYP